MPTSITTLPLEILTAILLQITDLRSLLCFILTCSTVHGAFAASRTVSSRIIAAAYIRNIPSLYLPRASHLSHTLRSKNTNISGIRSYVSFLRASPRWIGHALEGANVPERMYARWEQVRRLSLLLCNHDPLLDPTDERDLMKIDSAVYCLYMAGNFINGVENALSYRPAGALPVPPVESDDESGSRVRSRRDEERKIVRYLPVKHKELCLRLYDYLDRTVYQMVTESRSKVWWTEMGGMFGDWNSDAVIRALDVSEMVAFITQPRNDDGSLSSLSTQPSPSVANRHVGNSAGVPQAEVEEHWPRDSPEGAEYLLLSLWIRDGLRRHVMPPTHSGLIKPLREVIEMMGTAGNANSARSFDD